MPLDDSYTVSLLHMDGPDDSTTFADENSAHTWTAAGNAKLDTARRVFGPSSALFDGTGDYISSADHADWRLDGGSSNNTWTIDFRTRFAVDPGTGITGWVQQFVDTSNFWSINLNNNALRFQLRVAGTNTVLITGAWDPAVDTWYHVAVVYNGNSGYMLFVDGTQVGTTTGDSDSIPDFNGSCYIGVYFDGTGGSNYLNGWMDEVRISKGVARWTANFTPPSRPYAPKRLGVTNVI